MQQTTPSPLLLALTLDRGLCLEIEPALIPLLGGWAPVATSSVPSIVPPAPAAPGQCALVRVVAGRGTAPQAPAAEPDVRLDAARGWVDDDREEAVLRGALGGWATVDLAHGHATVRAATGDRAAECQVAAELRALCTVATGLLAGRREGVLVAASAVVAPDGGGWLLVGAAHSGKSTTLANLVTAGWGFLGDEEVLLHAGAGRGGAWLEGWPRPLPLDPAWLAGARGRTPLPGTVPAMGGLARGRWRRTAPLAGVLVTRLAPDLPTHLDAAEAEATLSALVRATPWLLADHGSARYQLGLLRAASQVPAWVLRLGRDTQGDVARVARLLRPLEAAS